MPTKGKDGYYHSKVTPAKGVKPVYFRARTLREFNEQRQRIIEEYRTGRQGRNLTFLDLAEEWWKVVKSPRLRPSSASVLRAALNAHVLRFFPPSQLARAIRYRDLQSCVDAMQGMARDTVSRVMGLLHGICEYGMAEGAMDADYSSALRYPLVSRPAPRLALTDDQAAALRAAYTPAPVHIALALQYYCGLRTGEALGLQWGDIDFKARRLHVLRQFNKGTRKIAEPKTENSVRWVDMPEELIQILLPLRGLPSLYVASGTSVPFTNGSYNYQYVKLLSSLGFARLNESAARAEKKAQKEGKPFRPYANPNYYECDFTPHTLRHNYATACYRAGVDPAMAMALLGHSSYDTTLSIYTDIQSMLDDSIILDEYLPTVLKKVAQKLELKRSTSR